MEETKTDKQLPSEVTPQSTPKWDYTSRGGTLFTGAVVIGLNLILIIAFALDRTVPAVHAFISGKPL